MTEPEETTGPRTWLELDFTAPDEDRADLCAQILCEAGATGIEELAPEPDGAPRRRAFVPQERCPVDATPLARVGGVVLGSRTRIHPDWARAWRKGLRPLLIGERLAVVPSLTEPACVPEDRLVVRLEPGSAFGTGLHPTTALGGGLLEHALGLATPPASLLDVGTGSGILALCAYRLGARPVLAIDHDPQAVDEAIANAQRNGCREGFEASDRPLDAIEAHFDVVVANLDAPTLEQVGEALAARLRPGGLLVVSGLREGESWPRPASIEEIEVQTREGWQAELGRRERDLEPPDPPL